MSDEGGEAVVQSGRDAAARGDWQAAFDLLMKADAGGFAGPAELPLLGEVAYAAGHLDVAIEAWERAHAACMQSGDHVAAAAAAVRVAMHLLFDTTLMAPVRGWLARAERVLDGQDENPAFAWLAAVRAYERMLTGDLTGARPWARRAIEVGAKCDPAACAIGRVAQARLLILDGDVREGLALLDDVGVATVSGDLDALSTGVVYCELVCALQGLAQYDLAEEWTEVMERWCKTSAIGSLHGRCRVHRAEILRLRGSCAEAEDEALAACDELRPYLRREMGWPLTELGRIVFVKATSRGQRKRCSQLMARVGIPNPASRSCAWPREIWPLRWIAYATRWSTPSGAVEGAAAGHQAAARALLEAQVEIEVAAGNVDRARCSRRRAGTRGRSISEQGAGGRCEARSRESASRHGGRRGRAAAVLRGCATLE